MSFSAASLVGPQRAERESMALEPAEELDAEFRRDVELSCQGFSRPFGTRCRVLTRTLENLRVCQSSYYWTLVRRGESLQSKRARGEFYAKP
jgi:hypothetical protein